MVRRSERYYHQLDIANAFNTQFMEEANICDSPEDFTIKKQYKGNLNKMYYSCKHLVSLKLFL